MLFFIFIFLFFYADSLIILQDLKHSQLSVIYSYAEVLKEYESIEWSINRALICNYLCINRASLVAQMVKHMPAMQFQSLGWEDPLENKMATHSSTLAWKIPWIEEPGRLWSMGSQRLGHDSVTSHNFCINLLMMLLIKNFSFNDKYKFHLGLSIYLLLQMQ